ncbi:MAG: putative transport system permease protein [Blastocatellia bacterium]|jgi:putative ABC transport system permease protein|nr:putative transport system permease protein [Blastocatellia bacterium]
MLVNIRQAQKPKRRRFAALWESFRVSAGSLRANKLRSSLTLVGIVVGVTAVIAVVTIIKGLDQTVATTFSSQGSTVFTVSKKPRVITSREDFIRFNKRKDVTMDDAEAIFRLCSVCWRTGVAANSLETVKRRDKSSENVAVRGITPVAMFDIDAVTIDAGRIWSESEGASGRELCVVGADIGENLFGSEVPDRLIGQKVNVGGRPYEIVGVLQRLGKIFGQSRDNIVYVPYSNYQKNFGARDSLVVFVKTAAAADLEETEDQVRAIMRSRRGKLFDAGDEGFTLETQDVFIDLYKKATENIYFVTYGVAIIALFVGGIVVMNIMLVSVTERTKEIGIRKAVGARQKDIRVQFLIEAITVTAVGGAIGVITGFGLAYLLALAMGFPLLISPWSAVLGVGVSSVVGVIFGLWPAWRAARLDPIEALRKE